LEANTSNRAVIDLNAWHHAIHRVTGAMALRFNRATPADLQTWGRQLRAVADAMQVQCNQRDTDRNSAKAND
jgi:hypothetical protein